MFLLSLKGGSLRGLGDRGLGAGICQVSVDPRARHPQNASQAGMFDLSPYVIPGKDFQLAAEQRSNRCNPRSRPPLSPFSPFLFFKAPLKCPDSLFKASAEKHRALCVCKAATQTFALRNAALLGWLIPIQAGLAGLQATLYFVAHKPLALARFPGHKLQQIPPARRSLSTPASLGMTGEKEVLTTSWTYNGV